MSWGDICKNIEHIEIYIKMLLYVNAKILFNMSFRVNTETKQNFSCHLF